MAKLRYALLLAIVVAALTSRTCIGDGDKSVRGVVVHVETSSIIEWDSVTIMTEKAGMLRFLRGEGIDLRYWGGSHLRGHMLSAEPVIIFYEPGDGPRTWIPWPLKLIWGSQALTDRSLITTKIADA